MQDKSIVDIQMVRDRDGCFTLEGCCPDDGATVKVKVYRGGDSTDSRYDDDLMPQCVILHGGASPAYDTIRDWLEIGATTHHFTVEGRRVLKYVRSPVSGEVQPIIATTIDFTEDQLEELSLTGDYGKVLAKVRKAALKEKVDLTRLVAVANAEALRLVADDADRITGTLLPNLVNEIRNTRLLLERVLLSPHSVRPMRPSFWRQLLGQQTWD